MAARSTRHAAQTAAQTAAQAALGKVLAPLVGFALDAGFGVKELQALLRQAAVHSIARRQTQFSGRINVSGIAASTGLPRAQVSRILRSGPVGAAAAAKPAQHTNAILSAWFNDPKFTDANGKPLELSVFGKAPSFERLVGSHGRGIPTRAVLDELIQIGAVELLPSQRLKAVSPVAIHGAIREEMLETFGERASELIGVMLDEMKKSSSQKFVASIESAALDARFLPLIQREIAKRGATFLDSVQETLFAPNAAEQAATGARSAPAPKATLTLFYSDNGPQPNARPIQPGTRRNLVRRRKP